MSSKLLQQIRTRLRTKHYSRRTEGAYIGWVKRFVRAQRMRHPAELGEREIGEFLSGLAVRGNVAASTQTQALAALLFLYREVLGRDVGRLEALIPAHKPKRLPVVLTREEVRAVLDQLSGMPRLVAGLLYGSGMRLLECLGLRVKDMDFRQRQIVVRGGKGDRDRVTVLPGALLAGLEEQLARVRRLHRRDVARGRGGLRYRVRWTGSIRRRPGRASVSPLKISFPLYPEIQVLE